MAVVKKTEYRKTSAYYSTNLYGKFLDVMTPRTITAYPDDAEMTISQAYEYRPDLLAYDLYGDANLWWIFAMRNPNVLKNPIADFFAGQLILLPKLDTLKTDLGL
jgi:hypothetical protein